MPRPSNAPRPAPRNTRQSITPEALIKQLTDLQRDLADISEEFKALNANHYLPSSVQPLVIAAARQAGFAAEHAENAAMVTAVIQQKQEAQQ